MSYTAEESIKLLKWRNQQYLRSNFNTSKNFIARRQDTATNGQKPYAVVVACSDSRVPVEHIFSAGIGELFVVRTAGNIISNFDLGSIEYGIEHLGAKVIFVMGHTKCGAVSSAMAGTTEGFLGELLDEIQPVIEGKKDLTEAIDANIENSVKKILDSPVVNALVEQGEVKVISGRYDIDIGVVEFFD